MHEALFNYRILESHAPWIARGKPAIRSLLGGEDFEVIPVADVLGGSSRRVLHFQEHLLHIDKM